MKKQILAMMIGGALLSGFAGMANAADGTINFNGSLTADACTVDAGSADQTVDLGKVAVTAFSAGAGTKASPTKFSLNLTDCPATVTSAQVKFDGTSDEINPNLLALDSGSDATGVGIEIADKSGTAIPVHQASSDYPLVAGDNTIDFVARYVSTAANVTAGTANATSEFTLNYK